ncbi:MAG: patatin-like phospholipase family protein [candidate division WOR-3 bacterium]
MSTKQKVDAVFQGGGVRGIAFVGAAERVEQDYEFVNLAGTSAGSIIAGLLAVGYTAAEIRKELTILNYLDFKDEGPEDKLGLLGKALSLIRELGIYEGDFFERWYQKLLNKKGKTRFGHVKTDDPDERYRYKVQVVAADLSDQRMLVLPRDLEGLGIDPDEFPIARAVRMSMSIPLFFEPVKLVDKDKRAHIIVDGGILSNYPVWLLDDGTPNPPWPTFGFKLTDTPERQPGVPQPRNIGNPVDYFRALWDTMFSALDRYHVSTTTGDLQRSILISTKVKVAGGEKAIQTTHFGITKEESDALYQNGWNKADEFLKTWDFTQWVKTYRV